MLQTVMIADDSMPLHALVKMQLEDDCLNIQSVYDGESAVSTAVSLHPDLILLDIDMPRMDGFEACRRIKADPKTASIPLIFLSADSISSDRLKGLGLGALDYIVKPFNPEALVSRVRSTLQPVPVSEDARLVDQLTGIGNKAAFEQDLKQQSLVSQTTGEPITCTVIEIDQLGTIGCKCGSSVANQVVRRIAGLLSVRVDDGSMVYALPNRRFAVLSSGMNRFEAVDLATHLKHAIGQQVVTGHGQDIKVTCSFGVCDTFIAGPEILLDRTMQVVNRAVARGGNHISMSRAPSKSSLAA